MRRVGCGMKDGAKELARTAAVTTLASQTQGLAQTVGDDGGLAGQIPLARQGDLKGGVVRRRQDLSAYVGQTSAATARTFPGWGSVLAILHHHLVQELEIPEPRQPQPHVVVVRRNGAWVELTDALERRAGDQRRPDRDAGVDDQIGEPGWAAERPGHDPTTLDALALPQIALELACADRRPRGVDESGQPVGANRVTFGARKSSTQRQQGSGEPAVVMVEHGHEVHRIPELGDPPVPSLRHPETVLAHDANATIERREGIRDPSGLVRDSVADDDQSPIREVLGANALDGRNQKGVFPMGRHHHAYRGVHGTHGLARSRLGRLGPRVFAFLWWHLYSTAQMVPRTPPGDVATGPWSRASLPICWSTWIVYLLVAGFSMSRHELWGDEFHSWNIAKASRDLGQLITNTRYEGHPPVWYIILWCVSRFTHHLAWVQGVQFVVGALVAYVTLFASPLPVWVKAPIPFGYYFLFEYGVLSRNYAIGVLLLLVACLLVRTASRGGRFTYYLLLLLASNTHLLAWLLAGALQFYFLLWCTEHKQRARTTALHVGLAAALLLPGAWFVFPPSESGLGLGFWTQSFKASEQIANLIRAPVRAFLPIPAWWRHDFWNTQFLLELGGRYRLLALAVPMVSAGLLGLAVFILRKDRKSAALFLANLALTGVVGIIFPLTTERYAGFIFIGFVVACWMHAYEAPISGLRAWLLGGLLGIQMAAGLFAVSRDLRYPFSNAFLVGVLLSEVPPGERVVTDYWTENTVSAFTDRPLYCLGLGREVAFLLWNAELDAGAKSPYSVDLTRLFAREKLTQVYLISNTAPGALFEVDPAARTLFRFEVVDRKEGAIERWSNLYLYRVERTASPRVP